MDSRKTSSAAFHELKQKFDLIYVDGDHRPDPVYMDAVNSFKACKDGGFILFDDYLWSKNPRYSTKTGIDKFLLDFKGQYEIILIGCQVLILKNNKGHSRE